MDVFSQIVAEYPQVTFGGVGATACATGALVYKIATRKKPTHVSVNCWFCNQDTVVLYGDRNCWDCPKCEQYNGFQENGDYNKAIPAQYTEGLNQGAPTAGSPARPETTGNKTLRWVNCRMLVCRKCDGKQTLKIRQLASFVPREDEKYDEEMEAFERHVEQTHKLCRPCQTAVDCYIRHQNRRLRASLFNHQLRRGREAGGAFSQKPAASPAPAWAMFLRVLAFLVCAFLLALAFYGSVEPSGPGGPGQPPSVPKPVQSGVPANESGEEGPGAPWPEVLALLPGEALQNARLLWSCGQEHQVAVVSLGLLACVSSVLLAGPVRLRGIDAAASALWLLVMGLHLAERHLEDVPTWLDTVKLGATCLCCLAGFTGAVVTLAEKPRASRGRQGSEVNGA